MPPPGTDERLAGQLRLREAVRALGNAPAYSGHLKLESGGKQLDVLLGGSRRLEPGVSIVDWRTAPLARVFFSSDEGDAYEVESDGRLLEGVVLEKNLLGFSAGELAWIEWRGGRLVKDAGGEWRAEEHPSAPHIPARPKEARHPPRSPLDVTLDPAQQKVVDLPAGRHVLLLGEAGFGKTTVALHRLASLRARGGERFRGLVIVPTPALRRLTELMLEGRKIDGVEVWTYDAWAARVARQPFPDLPKRESVWPVAGVVRLKRHRALKAGLVEYARDRPEPPRAKARSRASRGDLELLFGDRERIARVVEASGGEIRRTAIEEAAEHTRIQFSATTERAHRHVDAESLVTVDGRAIDEGTPMENAESFDVEDVAVLFELDRLRSAAAGGKAATVPHYDCVVIDEAQELAPLELALVGRALVRGGTIVVAGDANQQVDPTSDFPGWEGVMVETGAADHERATLEISYRCPPEVTEVGRHVLKPIAGSTIGRSIPRARHEDPLHLHAWLVDELRSLQSEDPSAILALICRSEGMARTFAKVLAPPLDARLVRLEDFDFHPGVLLTSAPEVKGLEFDYVVIPDADATVYPETAESRRTLYVALTRATDRLALACAGAWSTLLPTTDR